MKKAKLIMTILLCGFLFTTSCDKGDDWQSTGGPYPRDKTLAGSVAIEYHYIIEAEAIYDGNALTNLYPYCSFLDIGKASDTKISLYCESTWGETILRISIPEIPLSGAPHDVTFDYKSDKAFVAYNANEYSSVNATIKGWIKEIDTKENKSHEFVDYKPAPIPYDCNISITCTIDGKALSFKITSINLWTHP